MSTEKMICVVHSSRPLGPVVHWYFPDDPQAGSPAVLPAISASRRGVRVGAYLHEIPDGLLATAHTVHGALAADDGYDPSVLATHRHEWGDVDGPLVPIEKAEVEQNREMCQSVNADGEL